MNLLALLHERALKHPDRPALIDRHRGHDRSLSFGELLRRIEAGAARLRTLGLRRGSTILVFQPVSIELYEILLAAFHGGMRVMLADPSAGEKFLKLCCQRVPPDAFFGPGKAQLLRLWSAPLRRIPLALHSGRFFPGTSRWRTDGSPSALVDVPDDEAALITFTSGSTGVPKAAIRTHGFLLAQHAALSASLDFQEGEVDLVTLPVFVLANLASGMTSVLADTDLRFPGKADAAAIHEQTQRNQATRCAASPAFFEALLRNPGEMPGFSKVFTGGAPVFPDLLDRLQARLPQARVVAVFGSTEAEPMAHLDAAEYEEAMIARTAAGQGLCAGHPVPEIALRILDDHWGQPLPHLTEAEFQSKLAAPGAVGEVVVSGAHVLPGYLDGAGDEETKIRVKGTVWHRTGDAGWLDEAGRLWLLGRCAAKLPAADTVDAVPPGALDYPFAIEAALRAVFPTFRTAALGWEGERTVVIGGNPDAATLEHVKCLAGRIAINRVLQVDVLPLDRRHQAKVDYPALLEKLEAAAGRPG
jgi:acyl-CoA synthetase (AMP-forming)/AMP-acid ligase II